MCRMGRLLVVLTLISVVIWLVSGCGGTGSSTSPVGPTAASPQGPDQLGRRIVVFDPAVKEPAREKLVEQFGAVVLKPLPLVDGVVVLLPPQAEPALEQRGEVLRIDVDAEVHALPKPPGVGGGKPKPEPPPPQTLPWGVDRIDAEAAHAAGYTGSGTNVAVIDTGIDQDHPDLAGNIAGGVNFVSNPPWRPAKADKWDDDNGHGTHVAGIIAALDNEIGVVGVAPQASLWAVKVLDNTGAGYVSDVIEGLSWCIDNGMQVANMSLGTDTDDVPSFGEACQAAADAGLLLVAAAGNDGAAVDYPAAYASVIAAAAVDSSDARPGWSSHGSEIYLAAPGVGIFSTWKGGGYETASGTSMAAPHVSGTLALNLAADLCATADDLLPPEWDEYTGCGLVDAEETATGQQAGNN